MNSNFFLFQIQMSLKVIFHLSDFHNLKIINNIFFSFLRVVLYFYPGVYIYPIPYK